MPTKTGKTYSSYYKNDLSIDQTTNIGVNESLKRIQDGNGNDSAVFLSEDVFVVRPTNNDSAAALSVFNVAGTSVFKVDTDNLKVLVGTSLVAANTQYAHFGISFIDSAGYSMVADTHYAIPFGGAFFGGATAANYAMGTSTSSSFNDTDPASSLTISTTAMSILRCYWYVRDNITIDEVKWQHAADTATGEDVAAHLMSYAVDTANGSTSGDLSDGTVVAEASAVTNAGYEQIYFSSLSIASADVDAGRVILFTFAADTVNSDYTINATVKYHIR